MVAFSFSLIIRLLRSGPAITRAIASSRCGMLTSFRFWRAARMAASLIRLERSAPENPRVCLATTSRSTAGSSRVVRGLEPAHLNQQLVERLLALVVTTSQAGAALAAHGVDLVHEDDAGRVLLGLVKEVAHPAGADPDEHLDELRAGDAEEGHARLAGHRLGEEGLAGSRRADQEDALGDASPDGGELIRVLEELDDLAELLLGLVDPGDVHEGDRRLVAGDQAGPAAPEGHGLVVPP